MSHVILKNHLPECKAELCNVFAVHIKLMNASRNGGGQSFFTTSRGLCGIAVRTVRSGDKVRLISGVRVPVIMRKDKEAHGYQHIGFAAVDIYIYIYIYIWRSLESGKSGAHRLDLISCGNFRYLQQLPHGYDRRHTLACGFPSWKSAWSVAAAPTSRTDSS